MIKHVQILPRVNDYSTQLVKKRSSDNCCTKGSRGETCSLKSISLPTKPVMQYAKAKFRHKSCYCYNCDGEELADLSALWTVLVAILSWLPYNGYFVQISPS